MPIKTPLPPGRSTSYPPMINPPLTVGGYEPIPFENVDAGFKVWRIAEQ